MLLCFPCCDVEIKYISTVLYILTHAHNNLTSVLFLKTAIPARRASVALLLQKLSRVLLYIPDATCLNRRTIGASAARRSKFRADACMHACKLGDGHGYDMGHGYAEQRDGNNPVWLHGLRNRTRKVSYSTLRPSCFGNTAASTHFIGCPGSPVCSYFGYWLFIPLQGLY